MQNLIKQELKHAFKYKGKQEQTNVGFWAELAYACRSMHAYVGS